MAQILLDRIEAFVARLPDASMQDVVGAFALLQPQGVPA